MRLFRYLVSLANHGHSVGISYGGFIAHLHGLSEFSEVAGRHYAPSDNPIIIGVAYTVTEASGGRQRVIRPHCSIASGMDTFIWSKKPPFDRPLRAWSNMWRQPADQIKRNRYGAVLDGLLRCGADCPSLILFWTWGRAFPVADGDLSGTNQPVKNGYQDLRAKLHKANVHFVRVTWRWGLQFAMWVVVPGAHVIALRDNIGMHCRLLRDHLIRHGSGQNPTYPLGSVTID